MLSAGRCALVLCASVLILGPCLRARAQTTAFYYAHDLPAELLAAYDQVVVEPAHIADVAALSESRATLVAYFSLGELAGADVARAQPEWTLGQNAAWSSRIMDLTHPGYRSYTLQRFEALWQAGYRSFFLDTLDSYELAISGEADRAKQLNALCDLIRAFSERRPDVRLILNRGFAALPRIGRYVHALVAESLFDRWDAARGEYLRVPEQDRAWLLGQLREVRSRYRLPIIVVDYRPATEREQARETAQRIAALGFTPWVSNASLSDVGVGALEIMPRRVLILSETAKGDARPGPARWLAPVLEYLGYVPEYRSLGSALPEGTLRGRYAGVISALTRTDAGPAYERWLLDQVRSGVRVAVFGALGFAADGATARELGIVPLPATAATETASRQVAIAQRDVSVGFEAEPDLHPFEGTPVWLRARTLARHLELRLSHGELASAIATTDWGGVALSHVFALRGLHGERAWVLDPFAFLKSALALPDLPAPDLSTESGGRVALFAVELQGAGEHARLRGRPRVSRVLQRLLAAQPWPHALTLAAAAAPADRAALEQLLELPACYAGELSAGETALRGLHRSLTWLAPLYVASASDPITLPIAADSSYFDGSAEAYPLQRMLETYALTDAPRRLRPIALHYHAYAAGSPGGLSALEHMYETLAQMSLFAIRTSDYRARVRAFREQVIARNLSGAWQIFGGEALRTVRLPPTWGAVDLERSRSVATIADLPQGRYITFAARGARKLTIDARAGAQPHLTHVNGRIELFTVNISSSQLRVELSALGVEPLALEFAGLPPLSSCRFAWSEGTLSVHSDAHGHASLALPSHNTGLASLHCVTSRAGP